MNEQEDDVEIEVNFKVTNTGKFVGKEIAQVYVNDEKASVDRPKVELKKFEKITLNPVETKEVKLNLNKKSLAYYSVEHKKWVVESGMFNIFIGSSVKDIRLSKAIKLDKDYIV